LNRLVLVLISVIDSCQIWMPSSDVLSVRVLWCRQSTTKQTLWLVTMQHQCCPLYSNYSHAKISYLIHTAFCEWVCRFRKRVCFCFKLETVSTTYQEMCAWHNNFVEISPVSLGNYLENGKSHRKYILV